jgi:hypothetical protein
MNSTASYFGDSIMGLRQIHNIVDAVFGTRTLSSFEDSMDMMHEVCARMLVYEIKNQHLLVKPTTKSVSFAPEQSSSGKHHDEKGRLMSTESDSETASSSYLSAQSTDMSSHMESLQLTPLAKVDVPLLTTPTGSTVSTGPKPAFRQF